MDSGKRFERLFAKSLKSLDGVAMRIEDGGAGAMNQQYGDFLYMDTAGNDWLIECKATNLPSFPVRNLRTEQMAHLEALDTSAANRHSVVAINFWREPYRDNNECYLVPFKAYLMLYNRASFEGRASIPKKWLQAVGSLQERANGAYLLNFGGLDYETE